MPTNYYKRDKAKVRKKARIIATALFGVGIIGLLYVLFPLISYQLFLVPVFASQNIARPIPQFSLVHESTIVSLLSQAQNPVTGKDYKRAENWLPVANNKKAFFALTSKITPRLVSSSFGAVEKNSISLQSNISARLIPTPIDVKKIVNSEDKQTILFSTYTMSIPAIHIVNANVSTTDGDLSNHLVNFTGTAIPPQRGNAVVLGHSTLPWLFDQNNYDTILSNAYTLKVGDSIITTVNGSKYIYKIINSTVVSATDLSQLSQTYDTSYVTLITCTPPGTTWKRLVIRARLQNS